MNAQTGSTAGVSAYRDARMDSNKRAPDRVLGGPQSRALDDYEGVRPSRSRHWKKPPAVWQIEFDHIIPLSKGGLGTPENLQLLCSGCNSQKGASA